MVEYTVLPGIGLYFLLVVNLRSNSGNRDSKKLDSILTYFDFSIDKI